MIENSRQDPMKHIADNLIILGSNIMNNPNMMRELKLFLEKLELSIKQYEDNELYFLNSYLSLAVDSFFFNILTDVSAEIVPKEREALIKSLGATLVDLGQAILENDKEKIYGAYKEIGKLWTIDMKNLRRLSKDVLKPKYKKREKLIDPNKTSLPLVAKKFNEYPATKHCKNICVSGIPSSYYKDIDFITINAEIAQKDNIANYYTKIIEEIKKESNVNKLVFFEPKYGPIGALLMVNSIITNTNLDAIIVRHRRNLKISQIKGDLCEGDNLIIISDILTTGDSILKTLDIIREIQKLKNIKNLKIEYVIVFFDRKQGGLWRLYEKGLIVRSIFTSNYFKKFGLSEDYLVRNIEEDFNEILSEENEKKLKEFLGSDLFQKLINS